MWTPHCDLSSDKAFFHPPRFHLPKSISVPSISVTLQDAYLGGSTLTTFHHLRCYEKSFTNIHNIMIIRNSTMGMCHTHVNKLNIFLNNLANSCTHIYVKATRILRWWNWKGRCLGYWRSEATAQTPCLERSVAVFVLASCQCSGRERKGSAWTQRLRWTMQATLDCGLASKLERAMRLRSNHPGPGRWICAQG